MANSWHVGWLKEGVKSWNARRKRVKFSPDLSGVNFFEMLPPDYRDSPKTSRYFEKIDLSDSKLVGSNLSNLNFYKANFNNANLSSADMSMSNFSVAKFKKTILIGANADNSTFNYAEFDQAVLLKTSFKEAVAINTLFLDTEISMAQREALGADYLRIVDSIDELAEKVRPHLKIALKTMADNDPKDDPRTKKNHYEVFFGTNRMPVIQQGKVVDYDVERSNQLRLGLCEVIVPEGHKIGSIGSSVWKRLLNRKDDRLRIESLITLNKKLFFDAWEQTANKMRVKAKPTIFVHGYNTSFTDAVIRAAQIGYDLGLGQGIGLFSWPSKGIKLGYAADEETVEVSKYLLADFIEDFVENVPQKSVNLIAHSMGCRCLLGAFEVLAKDRQKILQAIDQTILAAADVNTGMMPYLGGHAVQFTSRTTSYVSTKDKALKVSGWLHDFARVGVTPPTYIMDGMDTILVSDLDLNNLVSHDYIATSRTVLTDIFALLKDNAPPEDRFSLEPVAEEGNAFWRIKN